MSSTNKGGRPPKKEIKDRIKYIMRNLRTADVNLVKKSYMQKTREQANYHTIRKYMDLLVDEGILNRRKVSDNIVELNEGNRKQRRVMFLYKIVG